MIRALANCLCYWKHKDEGSPEENTHLKAQVIPSYFQANNNLDNKENEALVHSPFPTYCGLGELGSKYVDPVITTIKKSNESNKKVIGDTIKAQYSNSGSLIVAVGPREMLESTVWTDKDSLFFEVKGHLYHINEICEPDSRNSRANFSQLHNVQDQQSSQISVIRILSNKQLESGSTFKDIAPWLKDIKDNDYLKEYQHIFDDATGADGTNLDHYNAGFDKMAKQIITAITNETHILIACSAGQSRSTAVAFVIHTLLDKKDAALNLCNGRGVIPNPLVVIKLFEALSNEGYAIPEWALDYDKDIMNGNIYKLTRPAALQLGIVPHVSFNKTPT